MFKKYIFPQLSFAFLSFCVFPAFAQAASADTRNDSFNVSHYTIALDLSNLSSKTLMGHCELKGISKIDKLDRLSLELYKLSVDSITQNGKKSVYQYNDSLLTVHLDKTYNSGDSFDITVFYHGKPLQTGWGGFYFEASGQYAFNLGVGLYTNPHNFGRIWFPCVDNFIDKSTFSFFIRSQTSHKVYCNGLLIDSISNIDKSLTWHWEMKQAIPCYLASVAVGNYKTLYSNFIGKNGIKPVMIGVLPGDTAIAKKTFQHLPQVLAEYEDYYAPYAFDRVGFVGVSFSGGAMEHATNVALPNSAIEAGLTEESLWAHELSHHWWGDLVTCQTAADMWLNEGWASYNESQYQERLYGKNAYNSYARSNHYSALRYAHIVDDGDRPLSPMPTEHTYGPTVYKKGADIARTLRSYLGDALFYKGLQAYMKDFAFKSANSEDFKNSLTKSTGVDMTDFFNNWVYSNGWPHFEITDLSLTNTPAKHYEATINERSVSNFLPYSSTPLELISFDAGWSKTVTPFKSGNIVSVPPNSIFTALDIDGKVTDATTKEYKVIKAKGTYGFNESLMNVAVDSIKDSALLYVVHHWISPSRTTNTPKNIKLSTDRYWTVDGIIPAGFHAQATVNYDGSEPSSAYSGGYLDNDFLKGRVEDSIVLMYKGLYGGDWIQLKEGKDYNKTMGNNHTDEYGTVKILNIKKGLYSFGVYDKHASINEDKPAENGMELYPNPTANILHIKFKDATIVKLLQVFDTDGRKVKNIENPDSNVTEVVIPNLNLCMGTYVLEVTTNVGISSKRFVVQR
jgi:hypothetical protein